ncbi:hypothetical protein KMW28_14030 [Flammeovirga yaeyamensis]|uniref:Uncharacterized protein n=1 Tax=Flammeovirga yaeyamensis TaxID=367791 RepID=A0AAX1MZU1_9BACT|nr:hypothetical protein [Flammeovirga yaeyamensis]MBB3700296.1 hypothetical protein [Flammeovirga yaeyamensis]NMF37078.1 hypothetical protein [Flammeovirga yaeyamensis]QWG00769.1 hypothetical protein KMW28_14030 [Flammeovirga yaeyamensis]
MILLEILTVLNDSITQSQPIIDTVFITQTDTIVQTQIDTVYQIKASIDSVVHHVRVDSMPKAKDDYSGIYQIIGLSLTVGLFVANIIVNNRILKRQKKESLENWKRDKLLSMWENEVFDKINNIGFLTLEFQKIHLKNSLNISSFSLNDYKSEANKLEGQIYKELRSLDNFYRLSKTLPAMEKIYDKVKEMYQLSIYNYYPLKTENNIKLLNETKEKNSKKLETIQTDLAKSIHEYKLSFWKSLDIDYKEYDNRKPSNN